jgi:hypothetical protein
VLSILDDDNRTGGERIARLGEYVAQSLDDGVGPRVVQSKDDDAREKAAGRSDDLCEIEVEGQESATLRDGLGENVRILHSMQLLVARKSARTCSVLAPLAIWPTITDTGIRMPRMQARPPMMEGWNVIRSN